MTRATPIGTLSLETNTHKGVRCVPEKESKAVAEQRGRERKRKGRAGGKEEIIIRKARGGEEMERPGPDRERGVSHSVRYHRSFLSLCMVFSLFPHQTVLFVSSWTCNWISLN